MLFELLVCERYGENNGKEEELQEHMSQKLDLREINQKCTVLQFVSTCFDYLVEQDIHYQKDWQ